MYTPVQPPLTFAVCSFVAQAGAVLHARSFCLVSNFQNTPGCMSVVMLSSQQMLLVAANSIFLCPEQIAPDRSSGAPPACFTPCILCAVIPVEHKIAYQRLAFTDSCLCASPQLATAQCSGDRAESRCAESPPLACSISFAIKRSLFPGC